METIQCSKCGAIFEKTGAKDKLRRFKDKRFMTTFHCPNCDARVILKKGEEPITMYLKRLERLKEQARRLGDNQEVNELQDEIDQINREIKMNAGKTKDKKFSMKGNDAYDPTKPKNIAKAKALSVAQGKAASDEEAYDPLDPENILKEKELAKARGAAAADVKDALFKGQKVTAIKSEQGLREGEVYTVLGEEAIIKQIVGENDTTVYKLQDSSGNVIVIESPEGLFYETKDANIFNRIKMAIEQEKQKLKKSPIRENFGQNIIRKLKDKYRYNDLIYGTPEERSAARLIDQFNDWCMNYTGDSKTKDENGYIAFYKGKRIEVYANTKYEAQQKAAKLLGAKKSYEVNIELAEKDGEQVIHKAVDADGDEETDSLKVKIGDIRKNMDAARKMGFDTAPYQKEIDKLEVKDGESITYKGCRIVLTELDDEWKYSVYQGSKKLVDGTDFDKQSARISAEDEIDAFLSKDAKVKDALMECMECGHKFDKRISPTTFEIKCPKCGGYDVDVMYGDAVVRGNYTVTINKSGQVLEFNVEASSDAEARTKAVAALELKMGLRKGSLQNEFDGTKNNIEAKVNDSFDFYTKDPLTKKGQKILAAMKKAYGEEKGEQIFYASRNKGTIKGVDKRTSDEELKTFTFKGKTITGRVIDKDLSGDRYNILQVVDVKDPDKDYFLYVEKNGTAIHHVYSDSKTRDSFHRKIVESYRGFNIIDDWKKGVYVINKNGKDLNFENTPNDCKDWIDDYIKAPGARDSKTKDNLYWRIADLKNKIAAINNDISNNTMARHYSGSPDTPESKEWYNKKDRERTELKNQIAELEARIKDLKSKGINPVDVKDAGAVCRECGKSYDPDKSDVHDPDEADKFCSSQCEAAHRSGGAEHRMNKDNYREGLQKLRDQLEEAKQKGDKDRVGDLEIEIADFIKETADANMVIGDELFDAQMIERLRSGYANINTIDPSKPTYGNLIILLNRLDKDQLKQLADANIKFVSKLARNRVRDKIVECPNCKNQLTCTDEDNGKAKYECGVCGKKYVSKDKRTKYSNIDKETKECFNFNMDNQRSKTKDDYKRMTVKELQDKAKQGYFELQGDLKPRNHVEVKYPDGKKERVFVEDQEIKIIIGDDPKDPSPAEQKVESNDVIYKEYTLKQLPETGEFEIYAPGGSIVGHAKALELAKLFVDRIVASLVSDAKTKDVMSERRA